MLTNDLASWDEEEARGRGESLEEDTVPALVLLEVLSTIFWVAFM